MTHLSSAGMWLTRDCLYLGKISCTIVPRRKPAMIVSARLSRSSGHTYRNSSIKISEVARRYVVICFGECILTCAFSDLGGSHGKVATENARKDEDIRPRSPRPNDPIYLPRPRFAYYSDEIPPTFLQGSYLAGGESGWWTSALHTQDVICYSLA